jgi:hypothetical protein
LPHAAPMLPNVGATRPRGRATPPRAGARFRAHVRPSC